MNNRGQLGMFIIAFVVVITGLALLVPTAQIIGDASNTVTAVNVTYTAPANGTWLDLAGQELMGDMIIHNVTNSPVSHGGLVSNNFTVVERVSDLTGVKTVGLLTNYGGFAGATLNVSYDYGLDGYIENGGARSVATLIVIFMAVAIMAVMLIPALRSGVADMLKN